MIDWEEYGKNMTFDQWLAKWHDLNVALFGEEEAKKYWEEDKPRNNALRKLWKKIGANTVGEYEAWEKNHKKQRNEFLRRELGAEGKEERR